MSRRTAVVLAGLLIGSKAYCQASMTELNSAVDKSQWDSAIQIAEQIINKNPKANEAKLKEAYALFQKGYSNSALNILRTLTPQDWKNLPQGKDRFVEIVSLFQKKIPLSFLPWRVEQIDLEELSPLMADELRYIKGRVAYDHKQNKAAKESFENVSKNSRYYVMAQYLLGSIYSEEHNYTQALKNFGEVFEPTLLDQSTEFWKDMGTQMTSHWGTNFKVMLDTEAITETQRIAELSILGLGRVNYATKDYSTALANYDKLPTTSPFKDRATLEKIWTLWNLNRHSEAQQTAAELSTDKSNFYSVKARILRALVLADSSQTEEARKELSKFETTYRTSKNTLQQYQKSPSIEGLPDFIKTDIAQDSLIKSLRLHQKNLDTEIASLKAEDPKLANVFQPHINELEGWKKKSRALEQDRISAYVTKRIKDLDHLLIQSRLIRAESYLEDREKLKTEIKTLKITDEKVQRQYDEQLGELLNKAIKEIEEPFGNWSESHVRLQFRQAELLWEFGTTKIILAQAKSDKSMSDVGENLRKKALATISDLAEKAPDFERYDQVLFFKGFAEMELGQTSKSVSTFKKYVQQFPKHEHVPDAYRILGDLSFDENRFAEAEIYYQKVLEFPESPMVGYALYKLGWCAYNEKNFARTLLALEKAYLWTVQTPENKLIGLQKETRHDLISIYAEVGDDSKAQDYFKRFTNSYDWLVELSKQYDTNGQFEKAQNIYSALIAMNPNSPDNMIFITGIIQADYKLQRWAAVITHLKTLLEKYGDALLLPQGEGTQAFNIEKSLREVASVHQFEYKGSDDEAVIDRVKTLNELYLKGFGRWPSSESSLYHHAQYLLEKGHNNDAKDAFKKHWLTFKSTLTEPLKEESLRNLIHTMGLIDEKAKAGEGNDNAQDLISFGAEYLSLYPKTKYTRTIDFVYASALLKHGKTEEGLIESQKIYDANHNDEFGKNSFKNLAHTYYELKDWKRTFEWAKTVGSNPDAQIVKEESYFLWAENTTDDVASAELFVKISNDPQMKKHWSKSLYNAFVRYNKAGKKYEALQVADKFDRIDPKSPLLASMAGIRAAIYQEAGDYAKALPLLEVFLKTADSTTPKDAVEQAHFNIALIAEAVGQNETAKAHYKLYLDNSNGTHRAEALHGLERLTGKASQDVIPPFPMWAKLKKEREDFEKKPLVPQKDLVAELKQGAEKLQKLTEHFLSVSNSSETPVYYAVETYCMLPFLYASYGQAVRKIAGKDKDLGKELEKVAAPIDKKGTEFAQGCIDGALRVETSGAIYEEVVNRWGWRRNPASVKRVTSVFDYLEKKAPWLEPLEFGASETELITGHLKGTDNNDPLYWQRLARQRMQHGQLGLSRLTFIDAINRDPKSASLFNGLACVEQKMKHSAGLIALFQKAGELGSHDAWVNQAIEHFKGSRLGKAKESLRKALDAKVFETNPSVNQQVKELTAP